MIHSMNEHRIWVCMPNIWWGKGKHKWNHAHFFSTVICLSFGVVRGWFPQPLHTWSVTWLGHCFSHMLSHKNCSPFFYATFNACKSIFKRIALHKALHVVSSHRNPKLKRIRVHTNGPAACRTGNRRTSRAAMSNASGQRNHSWRDVCSDIMTILS